MVNKRNHQRNFWSDIEFINEIREIKRAKSAIDKKDYSDADITIMIAKDPIFQELKKKLIETQNFTAQIKIQMDRKRGVRLL
jgi:hypothetical protein